MTSMHFLNPWMTCPRPRRKARLRLFCLPYAGGNASLYYSWIDALPEEVEICPIQLPGRGARFSEDPYSQISALIPSLAQAILPALNSPFALFGHSMGALISFELARYLRKRYGIQPELLMLSGHHAPHLPRPPRLFSALPDEQFIEAIRLYNGTPAAVLGNTELMNLVLPVLRADFSLCDSYQYSDEEALACHILAYGGLQDPESNLQDLLAWRSQTSRSLRVRIFPGDHFFIDSASGLLLQALAEDLQGFLKVAP